MTPITTLDELKQFKSRDKIPLKCQCCQQTFYRTKNRILDNYSRRKMLTRFCSQTCKGKTDSLNRTSICLCNQCNTTFTKQHNKIKKNNFCSSSCAAKYNNAHKTTGTRRSKLETWIEQQLSTTHPTLEIHYNKTNAINAELDIYIPSLKLAFELNGIFHYEPIYGESKLQKIQNNDCRKFQACLERGIELCIIDTSHQGYFKESTSEKFLNIIITILYKKMEEADGIEPSPDFTPD